MCVVRCGAYVPGAARCAWYRALGVSGKPSPVSKIYWRGFAFPSLHVTSPLSELVSPLTDVEEVGLCLDSGTAGAALAPAAWTESRDSSSTHQQQQWRTLSNASCHCIMPQYTYIYLLSARMSCLHTKILHC